MKWFRNISIAKKLYFVIGIMAFLIALELGTLVFAIHTLSAVRASVAAEGNWSKAQRDALYALQKYAGSGNEEDYREFFGLLKIHSGDKKAFAEIGKQHPDREIMRRGYLEAGIHPDDVEGVITLFLRFNSVSYIRRAIEIFREADTLMSGLQNSAEHIHSIITTSGVPSREAAAPMLAEISALNGKFTALEIEFSSTLGEGSRWLEDLILKLLFGIAVTVELSGLLLTWSISRGITKGLDEICRVAAKITVGDFDERIAILSGDEIGAVAASVNQMAGQLIGANKETEQFAYLASHDLQEPLRTISNYTGLLRKRCKGKLDKDTEGFLEIVGDATGRMQTLISDLLNYSRIGRDARLEPVDCNLLLQAVQRDLTKSIHESHATIRCGPLPVLNGYRSGLESLFQNLLGNAIKYRKPGTPPIISVEAEERDKEWIFSVKDNGIGIDEKHFERVFLIFQRLHNRDQYPGTGVGLAQCRKIVEMHGGKIWIESNDGQGSTFTLTIPKARLL